jgi:hypothetical protein
VALEPSDDAAMTPLRYIFLVLVLYTGCSKKEADPTSGDRSIGHQEEVTVSQSGASTDLNDFVEVTLSVPKPVARNPFTDVVVSGRFS